MTEVNQVEATEAAVENTENQEQESTNTPSFTQEQLDKIIEDRLAKQKRALEKRYAGVDVDHYRKLTAAEEQQQLEDANLKSGLDIADTAIACAALGSEKSVLRCR